MITLFIGGQKSGKSKLAEKYTLKLSKKCKNKKPNYIATYDDSYGDKQMKYKIKLHKKQRQDKFETINETIDLVKVIKPNHTYLIDCISMWILNTIDFKEKKLIKKLKQLKKLSLNSNIVFVLNDVNNGIIPIDNITSKFVNRTGIVGQYLSKISDEVYEVKFGLKKKLK